MAEPYFYIYDSAVPDFDLPPQQPLKPKKEEKKPLLRKVDTQKQSIKKSEKKANLAVIKAAAIVFVCVASVTFLLSSFAAIRTAEVERQAVLDEYEIYKSKLIQLDSQLAMLVTPDKIEEIAVGKLGMIKLAQENKSYAKSEGKNRIILSPEYPSEEYED